MKLLFISNIIGKKVGSFSMSSIRAAKELGIEFHMAANFKNSTISQMKKDEKDYGIYLHQIDFERFPFNPRNITAYHQVVELIKKEGIDVIHCNTPIGGVVGRLAGDSCDVSRIIYQAHGFHFYKGAPIINQILYKNAERIMAHKTDAIITMNGEDFEAAKKFKLRTGGRVFKVHGVGINLSEYSHIAIDKNKKRLENGLKDTDIVVISAGDIIPRKNYGVSIEAVAKTNNCSIHYLICGAGLEKVSLMRMARNLGIEKQIHFLGFRTDVKELLAISDIYLSTSLQEGLPRALMEAMAMGLPVIVSEIRGNVDLIQDGKGGLLCNANDVEGFAKALNRLSKDKRERRRMGNNNLSVIKEYDINNVTKEIKDIYTEVFR